MVVKIAAALFQQDPVRKSFLCTSEFISGARFVNVKVIYLVQTIKHFAFSFTDKSTYSVQDVSPSSSLQPMPSSKSTSLTKLKKNCPKVHTACRVDDIGFCSSCGRALQCITWSNPELGICLEFKDNVPM